MAKTVKYEFEDDEHAESFASYQDTCLECFKQEDDPKRAEFLLNLLLEMEAQILSLPTQIKVTSCTFARFFLLLMPLLNMVEESSYEKAKELTIKFI